MIGKTHQVLGITTGLTYFLMSTTPAYSPATFGAVVVGAHFAALLPDIDQPAAKVWENIPFGKVAGKVTSSFLDHRNLTHSMLGFCLVGVGIYYLTRLIPEYWGINIHTTFFVFMLAYASHLFADMFTVEGIPLFFPYQKMFGIPPKPFDGVRIVTGKWFENLIIFPALNLILILVLYFNWDKIRTILFK